MVHIVLIGGVAAREDAHRHQHLPVPIELIGQRVPVLRLLPAVDPDVLDLLVPERVDDSVGDGVVVREHQQLHSSAAQTSTHSSAALLWV